MERLAVGAAAPGFDLPGVDGKRYTLESFKDKKAVVVLFTCNHCPYVQAYEARLIAIQNDFADRAVALVAINSNDTKNYPEDDFPKMVARAKMKGYTFPYLRDESQAAADAYGASYTPEVFLFDEARRLRYTGRIDDNVYHPGEVKSHDLRNALEAVLADREIAKPETHTIGCTIKWAK